MLVGWMAIRARLMADDTAGGESVGQQAGGVGGEGLAPCEEKPSGIIHQGEVISTAFVEN
jgi:hypothetical protein